MSDAGSPKYTSQLLAGRWQVPLALMAAVVGGVALYNMIPARPPLNFDALLAEVTAMEQAGDTSTATTAIAKLLDLQPPLLPEQRAILHERMAEALFRGERTATVHNTGNLKRVLEHSQAAQELGQPISPTAQLRDAFANQWTGDDAAALKGFRAVVDEDLPTDDHRAALQAMVRILERRPEAKLERRRVMEQLLADEGISPAYVWWGLQRAVQDALDEHDTLRARDILAQHGERLANSDLKGYLDYLRAFIILHEGRAQEATQLVQWIDEWLGQDARATAEMDDFGHLPSLNRWLMGKINMAENRPEDALADFDEAMHYRPGPELRVAAGIGRGLALAALDRHQDALEALQSSLADATSKPNRRQHTLNEFQRALLELYELQSARGDAANAVAYLTLATELASEDPPEHRRQLLEKLGEAHATAAGQATDKESMRTHHGQAGSCFEAAAELAALDESRVADLLWSAAGAYDRAGRVGDERRVLERFLQGRSEHPRLSQAMLQLGRACEACGDPAEARTWYTRVMTEYPRLGEAAQAQVQRAGLLVSLGPDHYSEAEQALGDMLAGGSVAPEAGVYRDALLQLCDLLNFQGRYGEAIGRLEEFLRLYAKDSEQLRARFTLADAYRHSALALRNSASAAAAAESQARLRQAAELFGQLLGDLELASPSDPAAQLYARLALFYRGDCLVELNEPDTLDAALATFRTAAARYEGQPAALTAQMQIADIYLRRGEPREAGRAVEAARWLLRSIPAEAFTRLAGGSRAEWERSLSVLSSSDLFQDVVASTP